METIFIPDIVIGRLPLYLRALQQMAQRNQTVTSSQELGQQLGISAAQIRKDLSQFGEFGKQGTGYQIEFLLQQLRAILKVNQVWEVAVIGAGDVGRALVHYKGFENRGFRVVMLFDSDPAKIGQNVAGYTVQSAAEMPQKLRSAGIKMVMLAVPAEVAQAVADELIKAGIKAILNYAPINLVVPAGVQVQHIDPAIHLQRMTYYLE